MNLINEIERLEKRGRFYRRISVYCSIVSLVSAAAALVIGLVWP